MMRIVSFAPDSPERYWRLDIPKKWIEVNTPHRFAIYNLKEWVKHLHQADIIIGRSFISPTAVRLVHLFGKNILYELDGVDAYFSTPLRRSQSPVVHPRFIDLQKQTIRDCDGVLVSTPAVKHWVESFYAGPMELFPTYMDFEWWNRSKATTPRAATRGRFRIGCLGMSTHTSDILALLVPVIKQVLTANPNIVFYFHESVQSIIPPSLHHNVVFLRPWKISERPQLATKLGIDLMLVPLMKNSFNACKTAVKYFENAADKIPGIYSPTVYEQYVIHRKTGLIASTIDEWVASIQQMLHDRKLYRRISQDSYEHVRKTYNAAKRYPQWIDAIFAILKR